MFNKKASLSNKKLECKESTKPYKTIHMAMATSFGIRPNVYSGKIQLFVILDDLFKSLWYYFLSVATHR